MLSDASEATTLNTHKLGRYPWLIHAWIVEANAKNVIRAIHDSGSHTAFLVFAFHGPLLVPAFDALRISRRGADAAKSEGGLQDPFVHVAIQPLLQGLSSLQMG